MNTAALVSIVIPAYNAEKFIVATLESAFNQTYPNTEIILVNDGSTDATLQIVKQFSDTHHNLAVYSIANSGVSNARNYGFQKASGDYILFLDADDIILPTFLASKINFLEENVQYAACSGKIRMIDEEGQFINDFLYSGPSEHALNEVLFYAPHVFTIPSNIVARTKWLKSREILFDIDLNSSADRYFIVQIATVGIICNIDVEATCLYRVHANSMYNDSRKISTILKDNILYIKKVLQIFTLSKWFRSKVFFVNYWMLVKSALKAKDFKSLISVLLIPITHFIKREKISV